MQFNIFKLNKKHLHNFFDNETHQYPFQHHPSSFHNWPRQMVVYTLEYTTSLVIGSFRVQLLHVQPQFPDRAILHTKSFTTLSVKREVIWTELHFTFTVKWFFKLHFCELYIIDTTGWEGLDWLIAANKIAEQVYPYNYCFLTINTIVVVITWAMRIHNPLLWCLKELDI